MAIEDPDDLDKVDAEIRINEQVEEDRAKRPAMTDADAESAAQFYRNMDAFENGPYTSDYEALSKEGFSFPPPEKLTDEELHKKLWELIAALAKRNTWLYQTDHLSDRELYTHLIEESLHEMGPELQRGPGGWHTTIDMLGGCSEEDIQLQHTYYADDEDRARWMKDFPDYQMPEKKPKPYDRDRLLPETPDEIERRQWREDMYAQGFTDEDLERMHREEMAQWEKESKEREQKRRESGEKFTDEEDIPW